MATAARYSARDLEKFCIFFPGKFSRVPWVKERELLALHICLWEYTQKANFEIQFPLKIAATLLSDSREGAVGV